MLHDKSFPAKTIQEMLKTIQLLKQDFDAKNMFL